MNNTIRTLTLAAPIVVGAVLYGAGTGNAVELLPNPCEINPSLPECRPAAPNPQLVPLTPLPIDRTPQIPCLYVSCQTAPGPERPNPERPNPERPGPQGPNPERPNPERPNPERPGPQGPGETPRETSEIPLPSRIDTGAGEASDDGGGLELAWVVAGGALITATGTYFAGRGRRSPAGVR